MKQRRFPTFTKLPFAPMQTLMVLYFPMLCMYVIFCGQKFANSEMDTNFDNEEQESFSQSDGCHASNMPCKFFNVIYGLKKQVVIILKLNIIGFYKSCCIDLTLWNGRAQLACFWTTPPNLVGSLKNIRPSTISRTVMTMIFFYNFFLLKLFIFYVYVKMHIFVCIICFPCSDAVVDLDRQEEDVSNNENSACELSCKFLSIFSFSCIIYLFTLQLLLVVVNLQTLEKHLNRYLDLTH